MHRKPTPKDRQAIPDIHPLAADHPQRRRTDETILHTVRNTTSGRHVEPLHVSLPNGRPVDFTRPMGVEDRQRQAARERALARANRTARWSRARRAGWRIVAYTLVGLLLAGAALAVALAGPR